jgi:hypothetical protein
MPEREVETMRTRELATRETVNVALSSRPVGIGAGG